MKKDTDTKDCFVIEGKLALPYSYFVGRVGSTFITTIRDKKKIMGVRCKTCNKVFVPPRQTCERCFEDIRDNWVDLKDTGEITNFTIIRYDDGHLPRKAPFVLALIDPAGYATAYPNCDIMLADINGDGVVDAFDIDPFVELLTGP